MTRRVINLPGRRPLLDILSYGRRAPNDDLRFSRSQLEQIERTVSRTPEVMVKVSGGGRTVGHVWAHLQYIGRHGDLEIETDEGERLRADGSERELLKDWGLDLESAHASTRYSGKPGRRPSKLVHNIVLSMPAGTSPQRLQMAVRRFAQERFGLVHRYAMVLHTDQRHPHVHLIVKAVGDQGVRLTIDREMLQVWREDFARSLRHQGIAANASERFVRGHTDIRKPDRIHRAMLRRDSSHWREHVRSVADELQREAFSVEPGKEKLVETRKTIHRGWWAVSTALAAQGERELAAKVSRFIEQFPPTRTQKEWIAHGLLERLHAQRITRDRAPPSR